MRQAVENPNPQTLTPAAVMALQQRYGNQFVQRLLARAQQTNAETRSVPPQTDPNREDSGATAAIQHTDAPPIIQRLPEKTVRSYLENIYDSEEIDEKLVQAIAELTDTWEKQGDKQARAEVAENILYNQIIFPIQLSELKRPSSIEQWCNLVQAKLPQELESEKKAKEEKLEESDEEDISESPKLPPSEEELFAGKIDEAVQEMARPNELKLTPSETLPSATEKRQIERNRQKAMMISNALACAVRIDGRLKKIVTTEKFIGIIIQQVKQQDPITFNDVLNEIAKWLPKFGFSESPLQSMEAQTRITLIANGSLPPVQKITEVAHLLWGSFDWYVNSDNPELKDKDQLDNFILWLTDTTDKTPEPAYAARMNCWEGVIFVLYKAGFVTKIKLRELYSKHTKDSAGVGVAYQLLRVEHHTVMYAKGKYKRGVHPTAGDIVSIWEGEINAADPHHVALALGQNSNGKDIVLSLWSGETGGMLGKTTIQNLLNGRYTQYITFNTPKLPL